MSRSGVDGGPVGGSTGDLPAEILRRVTDDATVGRVAELNTLTRQLADARAGTGAVLLVAGEAGIGKTRILAEAGRLARSRGMTVLSGRAVQGAARSAPSPKASFRWFARQPRSIPGWPRTGPCSDGSSRAGPPWRHRTTPWSTRWSSWARRCASSWTSARSDGLLLTLDDLHWADHDTLALLDYLASRLAGTRVLLVGAARDDEHAPWASPSSAGTRRSRWPRCAG